MPHIIIEHSRNITGKQALAIGIAARKIMAEIKEGNFDADQFKIRSLAYENFTVGLEEQESKNLKENEANSAFIHISIKILAGRSVEIRKDLACRVLEFAKNFYDSLNFSQKKPHQNREISSKEIAEKNKLEDSLSPQQEGQVGNFCSSQKRCDISVDVIEMIRETYQKITIRNI